MDELARLDRRFSLHDLHVLMVVVEAGSMGKAAKLLSSSQPAVSRSIGDLEHALGARLLDRTAQGVEPTPFGCALLKRAAAIFDELRQGVRDIRFLSDPTCGSLSIGASIAIAEGLICSVIARLSRRYPRLTFRVHAADTASAYRALLARRVDLAVVHVIEPPAEEAVSVEILAQDPHVVVAGAHNPIARRRRISLAELMNEPWVLPLPDQPYGTVVEEAFRSCGLAMPPVVVGSTLPLRTSLLMTGRCLSMVPRVVTQFPPKKRLLRTLPIDLPSTARPLALVRLKNRTLSPLADLFSEHVHEVVKPLYGS